MRYDKSVTNVLCPGLGISYKIILVNISWLRSRNIKETLQVGQDVGRIDVGVEELTFFHWNPRQICRIANQNFVNFETEVKSSLWCKIKSKISDKSPKRRINMYDFHGAVKSASDTICNATTSSSVQLHVCLHWSVAFVRKSVRYVGLRLKASVKSWSDGTCEVRCRRNFLFRR